MRLFRAPFLTGLAVLAAAVLASLAPAPALAQEPLDRPLRVYLDCNGFRCDSDFFTQEIPWVSFVRDRQDADVHVLGTRQATGAGGSSYTFDLQGRGPLEGEHLTLRVATLPDATEAERRAELVQTVRVGLAPMARATTAAPEVVVTEPVEAEATVNGAAANDPWDRWVFRLGVSGRTNGESQKNSLSTSGNASASRVTEAWKTMASVRGSVDRTEYEFSDGTEVYRRESYSAEGQAVRSLGSHWGAGALFAWERSTFKNYDQSLVVGVGAEYSVFPYREVTRRSLTILYAIGPRYNAYQDSTIFQELEETLIEHRLVANYDVTQPWGNIDVSARFEQYITKFSDGQEWEDPQYSLSFSGGFNVQIARGLSFRSHGGATLVRNQIQLAAEGLTEEEILTEQREQATDYRYFISFGLSYRFGSIYSTVVNPRFGEL